MHYEIDDLLMRRSARTRSFSSKNTAARGLILDENLTLSLHRRYARARHTAAAAALLRTYQVRSARCCARRAASPAAARAEADA